MAHLKPLERKCQRAGCPNRATVELLTMRNSPLGVFCTRCGKREREALTAREKEYGRPRPLYQAADETAP